MKQLLFYLILIFLPVLAYAQGLEDVIVERYYISDSHDATSIVGGTLPIGSVTYRIWLDMAPGYKLRTVFCDADNANDLEIKTTTTFFNNTFGGATTANAILDEDLYDNTVMLDSWISLGAASAGNIGIPKGNDSNGALYDQGATGFLQNEDPLAGTPIRLKDGMIPGTPAPISQIGLDLSVFDNSSTGNTFYASDGQWWNVSGVMGSTTENRVLIAQITTTGTLTFKLNFALIKPNGLSELYIHSWPREDANLCEKCTFNGVITGVRKLQVEVRSNEFRVFPNPVQNALNIELPGSGNENLRFSIYDIIGNKVLESISNQGSERFIRDIDISSLPKGAYIIRMEAVSGLRTSKVFIKNQ